MKILITGGAGFIGSHITDALIEAGHRVVVLDDLSTGHKTNLNPQAKFHQGDIRDPKVVSKAVAGMDAVIHLAAISNDPTGDIDEVLTRQRC